MVQYAVHLISCSAPNACGGSQKWNIIIFSPGLFCSLIFFINDLDEDVEDALFKSSESTKLSEAVNTIEDCIKMQIEVLD